MILTFPKLGTYGRLGNQLFEVAALLGLGNRFNAKVCIPTKWDYRRSFRIPDEYFSDIYATIKIVERQHHYDNDFLSEVPIEEKIAIEGTFQSEKYWEPIRDKIRQWLMPIGYPVQLGENSVGIHIRRGDIVNHPGYTQCDANYFKAAVKKYFDDPKYRFYIISDEIDYVKEHFQGKKWNIMHGTPVEDLGLMASCYHHILSPSSFSWWGTYLAQEGGINIRPKRTHIGPMADKIETDMWQPGWIVEEVTEGMVQKVKLLCYADERFKPYQDRLISYAKASKQFDDIIAKNRDDLTAESFYRENKIVLDCERGGGYWLWKPYFILEALKELKDGDILLYMDSGDMFFGNIRKFLVDQLEDKDIILTDGGIRNANYTKQDCFTLMDCDSSEFKEAKQVEAGVIAIRNTLRSRRIIKEWMSYCQIKRIIDDSLDEESDPLFIEHRWDQSILTNIMVLYNLPATTDIRSYIICNLEDLEVGKYVEPSDLTDFTFVIPVKYDHPHRVENLSLVINFIQKWFKTTIIVGEQGPHDQFAFVEKMGVKYVRFPEGQFHRTKYINDMTRMAITPYVFNWDADVIVPPNQIITCANLLRSGFDFVYPYDGAFLRASRLWLPMIKITLDTKPFEGIPMHGANDQSVGGAVGVNKEAFIRVGMENENFISHGAEDVDRVIRFTAFGKMTRVKGPLYHFEHWLGPDSTHNGHDMVAMNRREIRLVKSMNKDQLWLYVQSWSWK